VKFKFIYIYLFFSVIASPDGIGTKQSPWQDRSLGSLGMTLRVRLLRHSLPFAPRNDKIY